MPVYDIPSVTVLNQVKEINSLKEENERLQEKLKQSKITSARLYNACMAAYLKHALNHDGIGWSELSSYLHDEMCNAVGSDETGARILAAKDEENPLEKNWWEFDAEAARS